MASKRNKRIYSFLLAGFLFLNCKGLKPVNVVYNINEENNINYDNISSFENIIEEDILPNPYFDDMVPQGLTLVDDYVFTSMYDSNYRNNSVICITDKNGNFIKTVELESKAHVGGIAYDKNNKLIWCTGKKGCINAYNVKDFFVKDKVNPKYENIDVHKGLEGFSENNSVAYLCVDDNRLFVGNYTKLAQGSLKEYVINPVDCSLIFIQEYKMPTKVQGITFYENDKNKFMLISRSYGPFMNSILQINKYDKKNYSLDKPISQSFYENAPMLEQISIDDNHLFLNYESCSEKYNTFCQNVTDNIEVINVKKLRK